MSKRIGTITMKEAISTLREKFHQLLSKVVRVPDTERHSFLQEFAQLLKEADLEKDKDINIMCRLWMADTYERSNEFDLASLLYNEILSELQFNNPHYITILLKLAKLQQKRNLVDGLLERIRFFLLSLDQVKVSALPLLCLYVQYATTSQINELQPLINRFHETLGAKYIPGRDAKSQVLELEQKNADANQRLMEAIVKSSISSGKKNEILDSYIRYEELEYYRKLAILNKQP